MIELTQSVFSSKKEEIEEFWEVFLGSIKLYIEKVRQNEIETLEEELVKKQSLNEKLEELRKKKMFKEYRTEKFIDEISKLSGFHYQKAMRAIAAVYINSEDWRYVVEQVRIRDKNMCVDCGQTEGRLIVHHTSYRNWGYGDEREINDCVLVCQKCHDKRHKNNSVETPSWLKRYEDENDEFTQQIIELTMKNFWL